MVSGRHDLGKDIPVANGRVVWEINF